MKKKKTSAISLSKDELQKHLERKISALERLKRELKLKASVYAREAQIEAALETVRARTIAMRKSEELAEVTEVLFHQIGQLGEAPDRISISTLDEPAGFLDVWATDQAGTQLKVRFKARLDETVIKEMYEGWKTGKKTRVIDLRGDELNNWVKYLREEVGMPIIDEYFKGRRLHNVAYFSQGFLNITSIKPLPKGTLQILERFAAVFNLTYSRFLDLKKAETQEREAQIEMGLERVRFETLAMQNSDEVGVATIAMFTELEKLDVKNIRVGIAIFYPDQLAEVWSFMKTEDGKAVRTSGTLDMNATLVWQQFYKAWQQREDFRYFLAGEEKKTYYKVLSNSPNYSLSGEMPELPDQYLQTYHFPEGAIWTYSLNVHSEEEKQILKRFTAVFSITFRRYQDLKQAEAQAREAQIEAALERVRTKTMAMHSSQEVGDTVATMFDELVKLKVETLRCGILIKDKPNHMEVWTATSYSGKPSLIIGRLDMTIHPLLKGVYNAFESKESSFTYDMIGEDLRQYYNAINNQPEYRVHFDTDSLPLKQVQSDFFFTDGALFAFTADTISVEAVQIFKRLAAVFGQTYRRYLDLVKAEAQAREAQIQLALERVRARTMAMHSSEDVTSASETMFEELKKLGIENLRCGIANIHLNRTFDVFGVTNLPDGNKMTGFSLFGIDEHPIWQRWFESWKNKEEVFIAYIAGQEKEEYFNNINNHPNYLPQQITHIPDNFFQAYYFEQGSVWAYSLLQHSETEKEIMKRFAAGFSLTFRRYQDLKNAEAQAKEAQTENALEKVRSRSLAMHKSHELQEVINTVCDQMVSLKVKMDSVNFMIFYEGRRNFDIWTASPEHVYTSLMAMPGNDNFISKVLFDAREKGFDFFTLSPSFEEKNSWFNYAFEETGLKQITPERRKFILEGKYWTVAYAMSKYSAIQLNSFTRESFSDAEHEILKRFGKVFEQAYIRFLDLQRAEAQAHEATIEAALERVRGKAMAMHNSNDLSSTASMVFTELRKLGINPYRCGVGLLDKEPRKAWLYTSTSSSDGDVLALIGHVIMNGHPVLERIYDTWSKNENYFPSLSGEELKSYYEHLSSGVSLPVVQIRKGYEQFGHFFPADEVSLYAWSENKPYTEAEIKILQRFASVVALTFRRYLELQKSEANALEAVRRASLDRVRAEIASMRTTTDLERITPLIWNELTILGIPFIRCGVFIMDDLSQVVHTFLSTPEGRAIGVFDLPYDVGGNLAQIQKHWHLNQMYVAHWGKADFDGIAEILLAMGSIDSKAEYLSRIPAGGIHLHCLSFLQGMLYVGSTEKLKEVEINIIQSVANAFSTAYARFEDFNKLEAANIKIEKTLIDLKQAQSQLIQSEKMASLGELTAGIAHEIQNPLNFVNNFSEVNRELIDETAQAVKSGNPDEAISLLSTLKDNEDKINHHGQRADTIVKGMLQHSRSSSGAKELTNINALADEYLRLSYHGLCAKDKSFNAILNTDFDATIGKMELIPQDIGRVLLNLYNNAFYAVNEKRRGQIPGYKPIVSVTTKKSSERVEIQVRDNGGGVPQRVVDKIFQPFFTTKPSGQGTGLGLSLSYDIVKAHGGEIKVETKEGEGSGFIIQLPA